MKEKVKNTKRKIRKIRMFPKQLPDVIYVGQDSFFSQWCCRCKSRHIWHIHICREKKTEDDFVVISMMRDLIGEKLRKFYRDIHKGEKKKTS